MPGVPQPPHLRFKEDPHTAEALTGYLRELNFMARQLTFLNSTGGITSGSRALNIDGVWVRYVSNAVANTEDTVAHLLGRAPVDMWVGLPDKDATVYAGPTVWTRTNVFLRASAATVTVNVFLF